MRPAPAAATLAALSGAAAPLSPTLQASGPVPQLATGLGSLDPGAAAAPPGGLSPLAHGLEGGLAPLGGAAAAGLGLDGARYAVDDALAASRGASAQGVRAGPAAGAAAGSPPRPPLEPDARPPTGRPAPQTLQPGAFQQGSAGGLRAASHDARSAGQGGPEAAPYDVPEAWDAR